MDHRRADKVDYVLPEVLLLIILMPGERAAHAG
jgi:hypothetical protein